MMKGDPTLPEIGQDIPDELRRPPRRSRLTRRALLLGMAGVAGIAGMGGAAFWYGLSVGTSTTGQTATKTVVVATPSQETDLTVGNAQPGQQLLQMKVLGDVLDVDWSPDGKKILASHQVYANPFAGGITIWNAATGSVLWQELKKKYYNSVWSPDSTRIASKLDGEVIVWDMHTRQTLFSCPGVKYVSRLAWSRDGKWLAINQGDGNRVYLFDGDTGISGPICKGLTSQISTGRRTANISLASPLIIASLSGRQTLAISAKHMAAIPIAMHQNSWTGHLMAQLSLPQMKGKSISGKRSLVATSLPISRRLEPMISPGLQLKNGLHSLQMKVSAF